MSCRVPYLKGYEAVLKDDLFVAEVGADCGLEGGVELVVLEDLDEGGLANTRVTDDDHFCEGFAEACCVARGGRLGIHCH